MCLMLYYAKTGCSHPLIMRLYGQLYWVELLIELIFDITLTMLASIIIIRELYLVWKMHLCEDNNVVRWSNAILLYSFFFKIILWEYGLSIQAWILIFLRSHVVKVFGKKTSLGFGSSPYRYGFLANPNWQRGVPWSIPKYRSILWLILSSCGHPKVHFFSFQMGNVDLSITKKINQALYGP
jgi:hypothetical protein